MRYRRTDPGTGEVAAGCGIGCLAMVAHLALTLGFVVGAAYLVKVIVFS